MKIYKKLNTIRDKSYNSLAKEYIIINNIKCKYYGWLGMSGDFDIVKIDGKIRKFNIDTKQEVKGN